MKKLSGTVQDGLYQGQHYEHVLGEDRFHGWANVWLTDHGKSARREVRAEHLEDIPAEAFAGKAGS